MLWLLHTCSRAPSFIPHLLCECVLFSPPLLCLITREQHHQLSGQMFYCSAQQLLQWLASIQMNLLQLAATAEHGQSVAMRRIAVVNVNDGGNMLPSWYFPWEDKILQIGGSGELGFKGCWLSCNKVVFPTSESQMFPQLQATEEARKTWQTVEDKKRDKKRDFLWHVSWSPCTFSWSKAAAYPNSWPLLHNQSNLKAQKCLATFFSTN